MEYKNRNFTFTFILITKKANNRSGTRCLNLISQMLSGPSAQMRIFIKFHLINVELTSSAVLSQKIQVIKHTKSHMAYYDPNWGGGGGAKTDTYME